MPESRLQVVPYGIGSAWFDAYREPAELARPTRVVLVNMKGVDVALRAFAKAAAGTDARLELYGVDKSIAQHEALARDLGISERVHFQGFVPNRDLPARIARADLLLHPTRGESFGQVLAEAAALGIPSVSSRATAVPEVVEHGVGGLLCPVDDADAFAAALSTLIRHRELRLRMGQAARRRALELWRWDRVAARLEEEVYGPLLVERGRFGSA
jgi:glycosyltransferase involved in cell wall biosynthesis